jgi:hypothetical protein
MWLKLLAGAGRPWPPASVDLFGGPVSAPVDPRRFSQLVRGPSRVYRPPPAAADFRKYSFDPVGSAFMAS